MKQKQSFTEDDVLASLEKAIALVGESNAKPKKARKSRVKALVKKAVPVEDYSALELEIDELISPKKAKNKKNKSKTKSIKRKLVSSYFKSFGRKKKTNSKKIPSYKFSERTGKYRRHLLAVTMTAIMVAFVGFSSYIAYAYVLNSNSDVIGKVGNHVILPETETPKVYIIQSEKSEIFQNPLFKGIKVGDNVLAYPQSGKVYIYRSSEDKVVNIVNTTQ